MAFELIPIARELWVEGHSASGDVGDYGGHVIAISLRDTDPLSSPQPEDASTGATEGLAGWGTTYFLVCDPDRSQPVWVEKESITGQHVGEG